MDNNLLEIEHLTTEFATPNGTVQAVRDVSYKLAEGEILGIVGESGSGKSQGMLTLMGLLASNGRVVNGTIKFNGKDISPNYTDKKEKKEYQRMMRSIRGNEIGMIFQDPMTFLNPILKIGTQLTEGIITHTRCNRKEARQRAVELMRQVGIPSPEKRLDQYPFEFSGGMRQRIIIAAALACNPKLIIADEPTTALDVTVQAQILELLQKITRESGASVIMITHDLGVVATMCDRIAIMYAGQIVEEGTTDEIFYESKHPYTKGLLNSINNSEKDDEETLVPIPGTPPDLTNLPGGCAFMARCPYAMKICAVQESPVTTYTKTHFCRCWLENMDESLITVGKTIEAIAVKVGKGKHEER
ncbi:MAG: ABC transporter ATP-binding protein [Muribaculum sp.]|nr:ABC transporter ATP-binding protein [Muribaculum sp.]